MGKNEEALDQVGISSGTFWRSSCISIYSRFPSFPPLHKHMLTLALFSSKPRLGKNNKTGIPESKMETFPCSVTSCKVEESLHRIMRLLKIEMSLLQVPININIFNGVFPLLSRQYSHNSVALIKLQSKRGTEWTDLQTLQIFLTKLPLGKRTPLMVNFFDVILSVGCVA